MSPGVRVGYAHVTDRGTPCYSTGHATARWDRGARGLAEPLSLWVRSNPSRWHATVIFGSPNYSQWLAGRRGVTHWADGYIAAGRRDVTHWADGCIAVDRLGITYWPMGQHSFFAPTLTSTIVRPPFTTGSRAVVHLHLIDHHLPIFFSTGVCPRGHASQRFGAYPCSTRVST